MNRICEILKIEKPIVQGPTNWTTNAAYAAAVSNAGALGVLGFNAGHYTPARSVEKTVADLYEEIHKIKKLTSRPFGVNISCNPDHENDPYTFPIVELMIQEEVPVAVMTGYCSEFWVTFLHQYGLKVIYRPLNPDLETTSAALKAGVDIIVATGFDEGGTLPEKPVGTFSIVPYIVDLVGGQVPVMAAGGIADARTARAAFALGAEGLFVGTAFLLCQESPLAQNIKEQALQTAAEDLLFYRTVPAYYRSLPGPLPDHLLNMSNAGDPRSEIFKAGNGYLGMRNGMLLGDLKTGFASFGLGISLVHEIKPVASLVDELMKGIEKDLE